MELVGALLDVLLALSSRESIAHIAPVGAELVGVHGCRLPKTNIPFGIGIYTLARGSAHV